MITYNKRVLSLILVFALLVSALSVFAVVNVVGEEENWQILEAETYGIRNRYPNTESGNNGTVVGGMQRDPNYLPSYSSLSQGGALDKSQVPYVTYMVNAPEAGMYTIMPVYKPTLYSGYSLDDYYMVISVNDKRYYKNYYEPDVEKKYGGSGNFNKSTTQVMLDKGVNFIRCMSVVAETVQAVDYVNHDCLFVEGTLSGILPQRLELNAGESSYVRNFDKTNGGANLGEAGQYISKAQSLSLTYGSFRIKNIADMPSFSYTVEVPASGWYDIDVGFCTGSSSDKGKTGYFIYYVDGTKHKVDFTEANATWNFNKANLSVYLTQGTHTLTLTSALGYTGEFYRTWCDFKSMVVYGGITKSAEQIDPLSYNDGIKALEAETHGIWNKYRAVEQGGTGNVVGNINLDPDNAQSWDSIVNDGYLDKTQLPYISYMVNVENGGTYTIMPRYYLQTQDGYSADGYYMVIIVNDKRFYKCYFKSGNGDKWNDASIDIELDKGVNVIRCISCIADTYPMVKWINHDYLMIQGDVEAVLPNTLYLNSGQSEHINRYSIGGTDSNPEIGVWLGGADTSNVKSENITYDNITLEKLNMVPYFSWTIEVPTDGYYDISQVFRTGAKGKSGYFVLFIDGQKHMMKFKDATDTMTNNRANLSIYLTAGTHILTLTSPLNDYIQSSGSDWCDFGCMIISGGVTVSSRQKNPVTPWNVRLEAETHGIWNKYRAVEQGGTGNVVGNINLDPDNAQSWDSIVNDGYLDKTQLPYISYMVNVENGGTYTIMPRYYLQTQDGYSADGYYMVIIVNDKRFYKCYFKSGNGDKWNDASIDIELDKGVNVIRCISCIADTYPMVKWINHDYLMIQGDVEAVLPNTLYLNSGQSEHINRYSIGGTDSNPEIGVWLGGADTSNVKSENITYDNITLEKLNMVPYFSWTIEVPTDGYYDISQVFRTGAKGKSGYFVLFIDGQKHMMKFKDATDTMTNNRANLSIYLTAGTHILTLTSPLNDYIQSSGSDWCDFGCMIISGGVTVSSRQKNPVTPWSVRLEAETYAGRYDYPGTEKGSYSGGYAVSQGIYRYNSLYTEEEMIAGKYKDQPHIYYTVVAPQKGVYRIAVGYSFGAVVNIPQGLKPYIYIFVNGKPYKVENTGVVVNVELEKGINDIVCGIFSDETYKALGSKKCWINFDYLDIEESLTGLLPESTAPVSDEYTRLEAEIAAFRNGYTTVIDRDVLSGKKALVPTGYIYVKQSKDDMKNGLDVANTPYVQYKLVADSEGDYKIRIGLMYLAVGDQLPDGKKAYIGLFVNGNYRYIALDVTNFRDRFATLEEVIHLKKGDNIIQITCASADSISEDKLSSVIVYHDYLDVENGIRAITPKFRIEAEDSTLNGYIASERGGASNNKAAMFESWTRIHTMGITFDNLNEDTLPFVSYVKYKVIAQEAGTYSITLGFIAGLSGTPKTNKPFFAMRINDGPFEKVYFAEKNGYLTRTLEVNLKKGTNIILVTCILDDMIRGNGNLYYIDHDYLDLSEGLTGEVAEIIPIGAGDDQMDVDDPPIEVDTSRTRNNTENSENPETGVRNQAILIILFLINLVILVAISKKFKRLKQFSA
jgi:hypothetical protein